jgi:hypothetical protein
MPPPTPADAEVGRFMVWRPTTIEAAELCLGRMGRRPGTTELRLGRNETMTR